MTLRAAAWNFVRRPSASLLLGALSISLSLRAAVGPIGTGDLLLAVGQFSLQPWVEWLVHVFVLHAPPRFVLGRTLDVGASHRVHHGRPRDLEHVFIDVRFLLATKVLYAALWWLAFATDSPRLGTVLVVALTGTLAYEWTHFLIHTDYAPRSRFYRSIWRAHRLHHFRNERYWFGITSTLADTVLHTGPSRDEVELSPTAASLEPAGRSA